MKPAFISDKIYDILKWIVLVFSPALETFFGVVGTSLGFEHTQIVLTIWTAANACMGTILGISNLAYKEAMKEE